MIHALIIIGWIIAGLLTVGIIGAAAIIVTFERWSKAENAKHGYDERFADHHHVFNEDHAEASE